MSALLLSSPSLLLAAEENCMFTFCSVEKDLLLKNGYERADVMSIALVIT